jgi:hypothetical protein
MEAVQTFGRKVSLPFLFLKWQLLIHCYIRKLPPLLLTVSVVMVSFASMVLPSSSLSLRSWNSRSTKLSFFWVKNVSPTLTLEFASRVVVCI